MFFYLLAFLVLLGPLVFVHELGHFIFAKLFNVRVDAFSMGFGPKIFSKRWGETEYCASIIPLGGYVKLYGQDPTESVDPKLKNRALNNLEPWKRFLVFFAGPLFNFLFAIVVFAVMLMVGEQHLAPVVARVVPGSQAEVAGFHAGDVIVSVNRSVVTNFDDVAKIIIESPNKSLTFRLKRPPLGEPYVKSRLQDRSPEKFKEVRVTPRPIPGYSIYGESIEVGTVDGLQSSGRAAVIGVSNPKSLAAKAGLKTGDEIVSFNGKKIKNLEMLLALIDRKNANEGIQFGVVRHALKDWINVPFEKGSAKSPVETIQLPATQSLEGLGIYSTELIVASLVTGSEAEKVGIKSGDRLVSVGKRKLTSFQQLRDLVQEAGDNSEALTITVERDGKLLSKTITPRMAASQYMIGVYPLFVQSEPELFLERTFNPFTLTVEAWSRAIDLSAKTIISIKKLIFRQVSVGTLGGPILIGKLAGDSMLRGLTQFLRVMAMISISLAIFNILPVPVLDGGHIFLLLVEVIRGRPITMRQSEMVQQVGLSLIVLLLVVVLFNDITKVGIPAIKTLFQ